jgi:hypothetical protein
LRRAHFRSLMLLQLRPHRFGGGNRSASGASLEHLWTLIALSLDWQLEVYSYL